MIATAPAPMRRLPDGVPPDRPADNRRGPRGGAAGE